MFAQHPFSNQMIEQPTSRFRKKLLKSLKSSSESTSEKKKKGHQLGSSQASFSPNRRNSLIRGWSAVMVACHQPDRALPARWPVRQLRHQSHHQNAPPSPRSNASRPVFPYMQSWSGYHEMALRRYYYTNQTTEGSADKVLIHFVVHAVLSSLLCDYFKSFQKISTPGSKNYLSSGSAFC